MIKIVANMYRHGIKATNVKINVKDTLHFAKHTSSAYPPLSNLKLLRMVSTTVIQCCISVLWLLKPITTNSIA